MVYHNKANRLLVFENGVLKRYLEMGRRKRQETEEQCIMWTFFVVNSSKILAKSMRIREKTWRTRGKESKCLNYFGGKRGRYEWKI